MKSLLLIILLCISTRAFGELGAGTHRRTVTTNTISSLPVLAFVHERAGIVYFNLHVRETGNLTGFTWAKAIVGDKTTGTIFSGLLSIRERPDQKEISFTISKDKIAHSSISFISVYNQTTHIIYQMPIDLLYEHFKKNNYLPGGGFDPEKSSKIEEFKKKVFSNGRKNPQPEP